MIDAIRKAKEEKRERIDIVRDHKIEKLNSIVVEMRTTLKTIMGNLKEKKQAVQNFVTKEMFDSEMSKLVS